MKVCNSHKKGSGTMLVNKKTLVLPPLVVPVVPTVTTGVSRAHFPHPISRLLGRLACLRMAKSPLVVTAGYPAGNVREVENGHYRISAEEATRDRMIDILSVKLIFPNR